MTFSRKKCLKEKKYLDILEKKCHDIFSRNNFMTFVITVLAFAVQAQLHLPLHTVRLYTISVVRAS